MKLQEKISADLKSAMKNKEVKKRDLLRVVIGEFSRVGKELSDEEVVKIIRKMKENADLYNNPIESDILAEYLPILLTENQIEIIIQNIINKNGFNSMKDMGNIMKELKINYSAQIDGKLASQIIKNKLS